MRLALRLIFTAFFTAVIVLALLRNLIADRWDQYGVGSYIRYKLNTSLKDGTLDYLPALPGVTGDKVIVMAKLEKHDTRWVFDELSEYIQGSE